MLKTAAVVLVMASLSASVSAQGSGPINGRFLDDRGRSVDMFFGSVPKGLAIGTRTAAEVAAEFKRLCLDTGLEAAAFEGAVRTSPWSFVASPFVLRLGKKQEIPIDLSGWQATDASVRLSNLDRLVPGLQCNMSVSSTGLADWQAVAAALAAVLPNPEGKTSAGKTWGQAMWTLAGEGGASRLVGVRIDGLRSSVQRLHIGVISLPAKAR